MTTKGEKLKEVEALLEQSQETSREDSPPPSPHLSPAPSYTSSQGDSEIPPIEQLPPSTASVEYGIYFTKSHTNMIICSMASENKTPLYFIEVSEFKFRKIDVQMHQVPSELAQNIPIGSDLTTKQGITGPVVGVARFPTLSRDFAIGFGNPDKSETNMVWEQVKNAQAIKHGQYDFFYTNTKEGPTPQPVKYSWHRTHAEEDGVASCKWKRKANMKCWKLVDHRCGETIALVTANLFKRWSKSGQLVIYHGVEKELDVMIILSYAAIAEKARRRAWKRRTAAAAGGSGG